MKTDSKYLVVVYVVIGAMFGSCVGFLTTIALLIAALLAAKAYKLYNEAKDLNAVQTTSSEPLAQ